MVRRTVPRVLTGPIDLFKKTNNICPISVSVARAWRAQNLWKTPRVSDQHVCGCDFALHGMHTHHVDVNRPGRCPMIPLTMLYMNILLQKLADIRAAAGVSVMTPDATYSEDLSLAGLKTQFESLWIVDKRRLLIALTNTI